MLYLVSVFPAAWYKIYSVTTNPVSQVQSGPPNQHKHFTHTWAKSQQFIVSSNCPLNFLLKIHSCAILAVIGIHFKMLNASNITWLGKRTELPTLETKITSYSPPPSSLITYRQKPTQLSMVTEWELGLTMLDQGFHHHCHLPHEDLQRLWFTES